TMFSVTFPPENSQNNRQLMNLFGSKGCAGRFSRKAFQFTFEELQSEGIWRTHCPCPCLLLRLIHDSTIATLPTLPSLIHCFASAREPSLSCCRPIWTTRSELLAALRQASASGIDQVMVFSE